MSAFIVSKEHIDALVTAGMASRYGEMSWRAGDERHSLSHSTTSTVGAMLWAENVASVEYRYSPPGREQTYGEGFGEAVTGSDLPGTFQLEMIAPGVEPVSVPQWFSEYRYTRRALSPVEVLKAIDCYEYQSCEHPEWDESEAKAFCDSLRSLQIGMLPGYNDAKWSI
jgi:hypothetical protein